LSILSRCVCCVEPPLRAQGPALSRRGLLRRGAAAFGAAACGTTWAAALAQSPATGAPPAKPSIIDVHHHLGPPAYVSELARRRLNEPVLERWTPAQSIEEMDQAGIATSITSITNPGVWFGDDAAAVALARACNEYAARLVADHRDRFGMFAILPLPDVEGSLREIEYGLDVLKADGVCLMTSYGDKWLGDRAFAPVMDELNRRKAVVYTHPNLPDCCRNLIAEVPRAVIEFQTDTTRTIASLLFSGTAARCSDIRFVFSHGGGTMPYLIERFVRLPQNNRNAAANVPDGVVNMLGRFYYDVAQVSNAAAMAALTKVVPTTQIVFGTDFPFRTAADQMRGLQASGLGADDLRKIEFENARTLLPRLRAG
jgi:predicted TIM-barrel fold metal-dependent hydrolase